MPSFHANFGPCPRCRPPCGQVGGCSTASHCCSSTTRDRSACPCPCLLTSTQSSIPKRGTPGVSTRTLTWLRSRRLLQPGPTGRSAPAGDRSRAGRRSWCWARPSSHSSRRIYWPPPGRSGRPTPRSGSTLTDCTSPPHVRFSPATSMSSSGPSELRKVRSRSRS